MLTVTLGELREAHEGTLPRLFGADETLPGPLDRGPPPLPSRPRRRPGRDRRAVPPPGGGGARRPGRGLRGPGRDSGTGPCWSCWTTWRRPSGRSPPRWRGRPRAGPSLTALRAPHRHDGGVGPRGAPQHRHRRRPRPPPGPGRPWRLAVDEATRVLGDHGRRPRRAGGRDPGRRDAPHRPAGHPAGRDRGARRRPAAGARRRRLRQRVLPRRRRGADHACGSSPTCSPRRRRAARSRCGWSTPGLGVGAAVQCVAGPAAHPGHPQRRRRGAQRAPASSTSPPDARSWAALVADGTVRASGERTDLSPHLPLLP